MTDKRILARVAGGVAVAFGVLTLFSGGSTLMGAVDGGAAVPFVLWFNTIAGVFYVLAGVGLWQRRRWALGLSLGILAATLVIFAGFGLHVARGGAFEMRTVFAMALRSTVWAALSLAAIRVCARR